MNENFEDWRDEFDDEFTCKPANNVWIPKWNKKGDQVSDMFHTPKQIKTFFTAKILEILKEVREKMGKPYAVEHSDWQEGYNVGKKEDLAILDETIKKYE